MARSTSRDALVVMLLAFGVRVGLWLVFRNHMAGGGDSDEAGFRLAAATLANAGQWDPYWPPLTVWLLAFADLAGIRSLEYTRLLWCICDSVSVTLVYLTVDALFKIQKTEVIRPIWAFLAAIIYLFYVNAISFSLTTTSEAPCVMVLLAFMYFYIKNIQRTHVANSALCGIILGLSVICRSNIAALILAISVYDFYLSDENFPKVRSVVLLLSALIVPLSVCSLNYYNSGHFVISTNSYYNMYIGNTENYTSDLNLFNPAPTQDQLLDRQSLLSTDPKIHQRVEKFGRDALSERYSQDQLKDMAFAYIEAHPVLFLRRALGRLARIFAPKTSAIEIIGGETAGRVFRPAPLSILLISNLEYFGVLFGSLLGLAFLYERDRKLFWFFCAMISGMLPGCLVAISKPRFSFPIEPALIMLASLVIAAWPQAWPATTKHRWAVAGAAGFFVWGSVAWLIFELMTRLPMSSVAVPVN